MGRLRRLFLGGASARASGADLGWAASTACDVMLGTGAGAAVRWLVTITGEPGSSVAFATNSNAISAKPTTAKKPRAGIAAWSLTGISAFGEVPGQSVSGGFEEAWGPPTVETL
jgi:hypothetical protein